MCSMVLCLIRTICSKYVPKKKRFVVLFFCNLQPVTLKLQLHLDKTYSSILPFATSAAAVVGVVSGLFIVERQQQKMIFSFLFKRLSIFSWFLFTNQLAPIATDSTEHEPYGQSLVSCHLTHARQISCSAIFLFISYGIFLELIIFISVVVVGNVF